MKDKLGIIGGMTFLAFIALLILLFAGWVMNLVALIKCDFEAPYKAEGIRAVGAIVPPVGMVAGWIDIDDGPKKKEGK